MHGLTSATEDQHVREWAPTLIGSVTADDDNDDSDTGDAWFSNVWHIPDHLPPFPDVIEVRSCPACIIAEPNREHSYAGVSDSTALARISCSSILVDLTAGLQSSVWLWSQRCACRCCSRAR
jgi:hypothetical protein